MKILLLSHHWIPDEVVPQRRWVWLSDVLSQDGANVSVVTPLPKHLQVTSVKSWLPSLFERQRTEPEVGSAQQTVLRTGYFPSGDSLSGRMLNQAFVALSMLCIGARSFSKAKGNKPDVVIGTVPALPTSVVAALVAKWHGVPYVIDLRDAWPDLLQQYRSWNDSTGARSWREKILSKGPLQILVAVTEWTMNRVLANASGILTTSSELAEQIRNNPKIECPVEVVRNVFSTRVKSRADHQGLSPEELKTRGLNVVYAGTVGRAQRLENLIEAAEIAKAQGFTVNLRILGDGAAWTAVQEKVGKTVVNARIEHSLPPEQLAEHYEWADTAMVHLNSWKPFLKTVPSKTYELMTLGLHISAVVAGESANLIESLESGDIAEPDNPESLSQLWINLMNNPSKLLVSDKGRRWVEHQRDSVAPQNLKKVLESVVRGR